jgi:hypothetical protein
MKTLATLEWQGSEYDAVTFQADFAADPLLEIVAPGDVGPAFQGELPVPPRIRAQLPAGWVFTEPDDGVGGGAGGADAEGGAGGEGGAGAPTPADGFTWTSDSNVGFVEVMVYARQMPDLQFTRTNDVFCRVPVTDGHLPALPDSTTYNLLTGSIRTVVRAPAGPETSRVVLHAEREIATVGGPLGNTPWQRNP